MLAALKKRKLPQKGDPQLDWFYLAESPGDELTRIKTGRQLLTSNDVMTKFTVYEKQIFKRAFVILDESVKKQPSDWGWQEKEGVPGYLPLFKAISIGGIKRPRGIKSPASTTTFLHDNKGMGEDTSVQSVVSTIFGLAQGFARVYQDKNCLDWYNSKLSDFEGCLK